MIPDSTIEYHLDSDDRIVAVTDAWAKFARENQAAELAADVVGVPIWQFVAGGETRELYELLFASVRAQQKEVTIPFRCDSPTMRRYMESTIAPLQDQGLSFTSHALKYEKRPYVALLDGTRPSHPSKFITICSWCKRIRLPDGSWVEVEPAARQLRLFELDQLPSLTHGICAQCADEVRAAIE